KDGKTPGSSSGSALQDRTFAPPRGYASARSRTPDRGECRFDTPVEACYTYVRGRPFLGTRPTRMQPSRLTLKSLWRLYHTAQSLLKSGHTEDAASHFHRIASARVRRSRGGPETGEL